MYIMFLKKHMHAQLNTSNIIKYGKITAIKISFSFFLFTIPFTIPAKLDGKCVCQKKLPFSLQLKIFVDKTTFNQFPLIQHT